VPTYRDSAIILQKYELGEADSLITLLQRQGGLARVVAKGARRQSSRKRGHVELFNQIDGLFAEGRSLDVLTEASSMDIFEGWRQDLSRVSHAYYAADITIMMLPEKEPQPVIYDQLVQFLAWINHAQRADVLSRWFEVQLLHHLGYWAPEQLQSESQNALTLLGTFATASAQQAAKLRVAEALAVELERIMARQFEFITERPSRALSFVEKVRELER
jgi:DNA repair protein RecO